MNGNKGEEVIFWIRGDGSVTVSDPSSELMPLFNDLGLEIKRIYRPASKNLPRFIRSRDIAIPFSPKMISTLPTEELWSLHENPFWERENTGEGKNNASYLGLKVELCKRIMESCGLCERKCGTNRLDGKTGFCGATQEARINREYIHVGEEKELIPSYTIFFVGCNMNCVFCHEEWGRSRFPFPEEHLTPLDIAFLSSKRLKQGARNINFVGGEPTLYLLTILKALTMTAMPAIPIVWNSNMYYSDEANKLLNGVVDIYLGDIKFGNNRCAEALSGTVGYWEVVTRNFKIARTQGAKVIVRHLPLPGHIECCTTPILQWVARELRGVKVSILDYQPPNHGSPFLSRVLTKEERQGLFSIAEEMGLEVIG